MRVQDVLTGLVRAIGTGALWRDIAPHVRFAVQVLEATPDTIYDEPWPEGEPQPVYANGKPRDYTHRHAKADGTLQFQMFRYADGKPGKPWRSPIVTQTEFKEFLRTGTLRDVLDLTAHRERLPVRHPACRTACRTSLASDKTRNPGSDLQARVRPVEQAGAARVDAPGMVM